MKSGAAATVALRELTFGQVPDRVRMTRSYQPDPKELYDELFREFTGLYRRNRTAPLAALPGS
jgi:hypothetical protein